MKDGNAHKECSRERSATPYTSLRGDFANLSVEEGGDEVKQGAILKAFRALGIFYSAESGGCESVWDAGYSKCCSDDAPLFNLSQVPLRTKQLVGQSAGSEYERDLVRSRSWKTRQRWRI